jgi:hypothetical protein
MKPRDRFSDAVLVFLGMLSVVLVVGVLMATLAGCSGAQGKRVEATIATCSAHLAADVAAVLDRNDPTLETELGDIAKTMGLDALQCAIDIYEAFKTPPAATGSATPATNARRNAVARARAWLAKQRTGAP